MKNIFKKIGFLCTALLALSLGTSVNKVEEAKAADGTWTLVTDATALEVGDQIIITAKNTSVALSTTQNSNNRGQTAITKSSDEKKLTEINNDVQVLTLEEGTKTNTFSFNIGGTGTNVYLYAASSSSNYLKTGYKNDNASWKIICSDTGVASIVAQGSNTRNTLKYNLNSELFSCYSSGQTDVSIYKNDGESIEYTISDNIQNTLINDYYNDGTYTKKTNIYVNDEVEDFELSSVFHRDIGTPIYKDRTTYYTPNALLMGDIDGSFVNINSGYRNDEDTGRMYHFTLDNNQPKNDWYVSDTKIQKFYVTLTKMMEKEYFAGWTLNNNVATYGDGKNVLSNNDNFVKDFLAFTAPCLEDGIFSEEYKNYFLIVKLEISIMSHIYYKDYLSLKMYVSSTNSGSISNEDFILSEARIYSGNRIIDEERTSRLYISFTGLGIITSDPVMKDGNSVVYYKPGTKVTFTVTPEEGSIFSAITVKNNNENVDIELPENGGSFTIVMEGDIEVSVEFSKISTGEELLSICDFSTKTAKHSAYTDSWKYGDWTISGGANNNGGWTYVKMGGKASNLATLSDIYIASSQINDEVSKIVVEIAAGSLSNSDMSCPTWGVYVYSDAKMTQQVDYVEGAAITKTANSYTFEPTLGTSWASGCYYKVVFNVENTSSSNGVVCVNSVSIY